MKITVDGIDLFELTDVQKKVIQNNVLGEIFYDDMKRRLQWVLTHKYDECFKELKFEWDPKLQSRVKSVPTNHDEYALLVFSQPDYLNRSQRDALSE